ncbi:unnamed protein product [Closterium sp. NIES-53]
MSSRLLVVRGHGTTSIVVTTGLSGAFVPRRLVRRRRLEHRTKHIALRYFLARELQQRGQLRLAYVASQANTADIFTKALAPGDHQRFCTLLSLLSLLCLTGLWSLRQPVYGLRQAPHECHDTLRTTLAALGFAPSTADLLLFLRTDTSLPPQKHRAAGGDSIYNSGS